MFLTSYLDYTKTIIPLALMASELITHSAFYAIDSWAIDSWSIDSWAIDSEPIRARVIIVKERFIRSIMRFSLFSLSRFVTRVRDHSQSYLCNINTYTSVGL